MAAPLPTVQVLAQFTPGTWTDISQFALMVNTDRPSTRLQGPLWQYQAGTASIVLDNSDGRFDPDNLAGPYISSTGLQQVVWTAGPGQTKTWTAPRNLAGTTIKVEAWGPASTDNSGGGNGGAGGEYAAENAYPVIPGNSYVAVSPAQNSGSSTTFDGTGVVAHGAAAGSITGGTGSSNSLHFPGGNGGAGGVNPPNERGGGGGSSGGSTAPGNSGQSGDAGARGGSAPASGYGGGAGASTSALAGENGKGPGAGGGGAALTNVGNRGTIGRPGKGGGGQVRLTYLVTVTSAAVQTQVLPMVPVRVTAKWGNAGTAGGGLTTRTGAFLNEANMSAADFNGANALWNTFTGHPVPATRVFEAASTFTYTADMIQMVAAGVKLCIDFKPACNPVSATDLANLTTVLQTLTAAGAVCDVSLWHEPFFAGLTAAQYTAMIQYYGPTVRQFYPLYCCFSGSDADPVNGYYPGDAWVDGVAVDAYASSATTQITNAASMAPAKPFGIWEFNSSTGINNLTGDNTTFTATAGNWVGSGNCNTSRATSPVYGISSGSLQMSSITSGTMSAASCAAANFATQMLACTSGDQIVVSGFFRAQASPKSCQVGADFYTSGGVFVSTVLSPDATATVTDTTSGWTGAFGTLTAPATAAWCRAKLVVNTTGGATELHYGALAHLSNATASGQTKAAATTFFQFVQSFMTGRQQAGQPNADVLLFNSAVPGTNIVSVIDNPGDYRIGLWQAIYTALNGTQAGGYPLFTGFADSWTETPVTYSAGYSEVTLAATDGFKVLAGNTLPATSPTGANDDSGQRAGRILDAAGWPGAARQVDTGDTLQQATTLGSDALSLLQLTADTEIGEVYINGSGNVVFRHRQAILTDTRSVFPQAVFGDQPGVQGAQVTWHGNGSSGIGIDAAPWTSFFPPSSPCSKQIWVWSSAAYAAGVQMVFNFYDSTLTLISTSSDTVTATGPAPVLLSFSATSPALTVFMNVQIQVQGSPASTVIFSAAAAVPLDGNDVVFVPAAAPWISLTGATTTTNLLTWTPQANVPGELPYAAAGRANDDTTLANDIQITVPAYSGDPSPVLQEATDPVSVFIYQSERSYARTDLLLPDDPTALLYANWVLYISKTSEDRFDTLTIDPLADTADLYPQVLGREIGDRIQVWRTPPGVAQRVTKDVFVRGISHAHDPGQQTWQTTWTLQSASRYSGFMTLDSASSGLLDVDALAY